MAFRYKNDLSALRTFAQKLAPHDGRILTGLIGELSTCQLLNLHWKPDGNGYDAIDSAGNRVQIKSRRDSKGGRVNPYGTTGKFTSFDFNYALYTELAPNFEVISIYQLDSEDVRRFARPRRNDVGVSKFLKYGKQVYPKKKVLG